jgi:hypothetical protein
MVERLERLLLADRQASMTAAAMSGAKDFIPPDVEGQLEAFSAYLNSDDPGQSRSPADVLADRRTQELLT